MYIHTILYLIFPSCQQMNVTEYLAQMDEARCVKYQKNDFKAGQIALFKADFDNNTKMRRTSRGYTVRVNCFARPCKTIARLSIK